MAESGAWESWRRNAADEYYNLLLQGFRVGQLNLKKDVPSGLAQLADPYDPAANAVYQSAPYGLLDLSYYKGKLYFYWGVVPALLVFWPFVALSGHYLFQSQAVTLFCAVGFLASVALLHGLWRRYFAEASIGMVVTCVVALGMATGLPILLARSQVYEVPVSCGYMLTMLALVAIWRAFHDPERKYRWLVAASLAYGLAIGARPSLLFGAVILLVPVIQAQRERRPILVLLTAAVVPIALIGLGLMLYNARRFGSPFEFGWHYQLSPVKQDSAQQFSLRYLWFNSRVYFLGPVRWSSRFPFVHDIAAPPLPAGFGSLQTPFGVLANIPLVWLALAVPVGWRNRSESAASILRWFVMTVAILFGACALTIGSFSVSSFRYEVDFLPALVLLAVVGILGLERTLADRPDRRRAVRWGWGMLVGFSVAFNLLVSVQYYAEAHYEVGTALLQEGRVQEAVNEYERALRIDPDYGQPHGNLGIALIRLGRVEEGIEQCEQALRLNPDYAEAHNNMGAALEQAGRIQEAIVHYQQALRIKPDYAEAHKNLGSALGRMGKLPEAIGQFEEAMRIKPDYADAHTQLGVLLDRLGRMPDAIGQFEQALQINPDDAEAHNNMGIALGQMGNVAEAIRQLEEALRIRPEYAEAHYNLGLALARSGRVPEAIGHWEQAVRIKPDYAEAHCNLGIALEQTGRLQEAIGHYQQALRIKPDYTTAQAALARLRAGQ
jgi:tetratricopeptide (TPR) repeat protein